jgi:hypothetical protein
MPLLIEALIHLSRLYVEQQNTSRAWLIYQSLAQIPSMPEDIKAELNQLGNLLQTAQLNGAKVETDEALDFGTVVALLS